MKGYRTIILAVVQLLFAGATAFGFVLPEEADQEITNHIEAIVSGVMTVFAFAQVYLRTKTDTKVGKSE